jgi:hypothetical protein
MTMDSDVASRRDLLVTVAAASLGSLLLGPARSAAQSPLPVKVDTKGLVAKIKFEEVLSGFLSEVNGK